MPLNALGEAVLGLLDKESITQRLNWAVTALGETYSRGWVRDVRGWCETPLVMWPDYKPGLGRWTAYIVQCRNCTGCRKSRQADWASRAGLEMAVAERTWLCTFTLGPKARRALQRVGVTAEADRLNAVLTRLFDRLRHSHGIRYVCVSEPHKDGVPHWHALIHQGNRRLSYRDLRGQWGQGFFHAVIAPDAEAAIYVAKYIAKHPGRRVRASRSYGRFDARPFARQAERRTPTP